jgi:hypothetical protein
MKLRKEKEKEREKKNPGVDGYKGHYFIEICEP